MEKRRLLFLLHTRSTLMALTCFQPSYLWYVVVCWLLTCSSWSSHHGKSVEAPRVVFQQYNTDLHVDAEMLNLLGKPSLIPKEMVPWLWDGYCPVCLSSRKQPWWENGWAVSFAPQHHGSESKPCKLKCQRSQMFTRTKGHVATETLFSA